MPDFLHTFIRLINWASVRPETMTARGRVEETAAPLPSGSARMSASVCWACSAVTQIFGTSATPTKPRTVSNLACPAAGNPHSISLRGP